MANTVSIGKVASILVPVGNRPNDLGGICTHPNVNHWSSYKPWKLPALFLNEATREATSGFTINNQKLVYETPTGGLDSPFRLDDFDGYNHNARKPQNGITNENKRVTEDGDTKGPGSASFSISIKLPNTDVIKRLMVEKGITHCSIYDENDVVIEPRMSLDLITETNYILFSSVILDLSENSVGSTFNRELKIYYGNQTDYKMFQIPGGDVYTITGIILARGVRLYEGIVPTDSFIPSNITEANYTSSYDAANQRLTISYLEIKGMGKNAGDEYKNTIMYSNFNSKINWELRYTAEDNLGNILSNNVIVPNWSTLAAYSEMPKNVLNTYGTFRIVNGYDMVINNLPHGSKVTFRLTYTSINW